MSIQKHRWWAYGILAVAAVYLVAFYVVPGLLSSSDGKAVSADCIAHQKVGLDHGKQGGQQWRITASIEKIERNSRCTYWFLKVHFSPHGVPRGSWIEGWGIPAGGHLPATATIDANEEEEGRAVGGVVGSRVNRVVLTLSGGRTMVVSPKDPSEGLLRRFIWLHGLRYFFIFHPPGEKVRMAKLLDNDGKVIFVAHSQEGELLGNMVY